MRSGFTLVELLLVLALLVVGAAIASVGLSAGSDRSQLQQAADKLTVVWSQARLEAIESGEPRIFRCRIGDSWGYVGTGDSPELTSGEAVSSPSELKLGESDSNVVFKRLIVTDRPGATPLGGGVREGDLSAMIVFTPDGATSDAEATLATESGRILLVTLRGLTGSTRVTEPADDANGAGLGNTGQGRAAR